MLLRPFCFGREMGVGKGKAKNQLVLVGGARPKMQKPSKREWTVSKEDAFLEALEATCNVSAAAREAGVSVSAAYRRRQASASFRVRWHQAIGHAYQRLELALIERSLVGTEKIVRRKDGSEERVMEYPNAIALTLLRMHRETAAEALAEEPPEDMDEIRERLILKIERLRTRHDAAPDGGEE